MGNDVLRIMALDVGDRRIGIAVSDELGWTAQGVETYTRKGSESDYAYIKKLIDRYSPEKLVIGLPKNMNGTIGPQAEKVLAFAKELSQYAVPEIVFWDERLTTVAAEKAMISADVSRKKRKLSIDKLAATYILQNYLDSISKK